MAGYQTIEALRPILHKGPIAAPVVDRSLVYKPPRADCPTYLQIQRMIEMRKQGASIPAIQREVGFTQSTVRRHVKHVPPPEGGWPKGGRPARVSRARVEQLRRWEFSYSDIAKEVGCHISNVEQILNGWKKSKASMRTRPSLSFERVVAHVTGISVQTLRAAGLRENNDVAKARMILHWLVRFKRPHLSFVAISKSVGGFDRSTCSRSFRTVETAVAALGVKTTGRTQHIVERLWAAEWPKASA